MEIPNKYENGLSTVQKTSMDLTSPALSEVIAEIDRAAGRIATPGLEENKEDAKLVGGIESRSSQFIQFTLESTFFALPLSNALEIGHRPEIASLPNLGLASSSSMQIVPWFGIRNCKQKLHWARLSPNIFHFLLL